ncbi:MAG: hypothetical protein LBG08_09030 [Spirochaetaceae bacterium]|jgi:predicted nucleic acid-binding Zn ribbon protein|nr:hypothetical protein [Spirochaetaceae bacterium]
MGGWIQVFILVILGVFLLWFGYTLFFGTRRRPGVYVRGGGQKKTGTLPEKDSPGSSGAPKTCPVCSAWLVPGERVKSTAFPSSPGGKDRLMHIAGCFYCIEGNRLRICPVCGAELARDEILFARFFDKAGRSHVHILGCSRCRGPGSR